MEKMKRIGLFAVTSLLAVSAYAEQPVTRKGSAVLHFKTTSDLVATEAVPEADGSLRLQSNAQGNSQKQSLDLTVAGLTPSTTYLVGALVGNATNSAVVPLYTNDGSHVVAGTFTTDARGKARISYTGKAAKGNGKGNGSKGQLPEDLNPLSDLRAVTVYDAATQTVAYAWINQASTYQVLVKRNLTPTEGSTAAGSISLTATHSKTSFRLLADGLTPGAEYKLALDLAVVATALADENGRLELNGWPESAPAVLDVRLLEVVDSLGATVLAAPLPQ